MSTSGAISDFTEKEKSEFRGLYAKYVTLQLDDQQVLNALGGNEQTFEKFKAYTHLMRKLLIRKQTAGIRLTI